MIKLFLVEDEIIMRDGIKNNINWEAEGIEFVGEASDGELAYPLIQKTEPDILITDIKMPFMDGLELSGLVRKSFPNMKIIILSGYDDFSYAQQAVSLQVAEYLLKPISPLKLLESVRKVVNLIQEERQAKGNGGYGDQAQDEILRLEKKKFFQKMVGGQMAMSDILDRGKALGMELSAACYRLALCYIGIDNGRMQDYSEEQNVLMAELDSVMTETDQWYVFDRGTEGFAILCMGDSEENLDQRGKLYETRITQITQKYPGANYFIGIGNCVHRLRELGESYYNANKAFAHRYMMTGNQIIYADQLDQTTQGAQNEEMSIQSVDIHHLDRKIMRNFLLTGSQDEIPHFVREYIEGMGRQNVKSAIFLQYVTMDVYFNIAACLEDIGCSAEEATQECGDINEVIRQFSTVEKVEEFFEQFIGVAMRLRDGASNKQNSQLIQQAKVYIKENYNNEEISLNTVAAVVNISPNYFSSIFSQEEGKTFVEYLTSVRMERARELLATTQMKSADIAYEIGYKDPHYFSYMFKKTQGCTAREFRSHQK